MSLANLCLDVVIDDVLKSDDILDRLNKLRDDGKINNDTLYQMLMMGKNPKISRLYIYINRHIESTGEKYIKVTARSKQSPVLLTSAYDEEIMIPFDFNKKTLINNLEYKLVEITGDFNNLRFTQFNPEKADVVGLNFRDEGFKIFEDGNKYHICY